MNHSLEAWCQRLSAQLPGWHVWYSSTPGRGWYAVPAPAGTKHTDALDLPDRLGPFKAPQDLRKAAQERYGWGDYCQTCVGQLAQDCGHRQPERAQRA